MALNGRRPIVKKKLADKVEEELELMIREGRYAVGDPLPPERELMDIFGVGRPSIRDALSALSRKGLVKISSGERTRVARPTADDIISELSGLSRDFLSTHEGVRYFEQLRLFFEVGLVRYAAQSATIDQLDELEEALLRNEETIYSNALFRKTDIHFHGVIAKLPGNPIFLAVHRALVDWLIISRPDRPDHSEGNKTSYEHHKEIFERIRDRDADGAEKAIEVHLRTFSMAS